MRRCPLASATVVFDTSSTDHGGLRTGPAVATDTTFIDPSRERPENAMDPIASLATLLVSLAGLGVSSLVRFAMDSADEDLAAFTGRGRRGLSLDE
jgi:hypothetical protein